MKQVYDVIIIGGGIVGLATALELQNRNPDAAIAVLEKEPKLASHRPAGPASMRPSCPATAMPEARLAASPPRAARPGGC